MIKYRWTFSLKQVVEFVRKDAEIAIEIDNEHFHQKVIKSNLSSTEEAEQVAIQFCEQLAQKIKSLIEQETKHLKQAKE